MPIFRYKPIGENRVVQTPRRTGRDRKSTRLNSSHLVISYAVFCLKNTNVRAGHTDADGEPEEGHLQPVLLPPRHHDGGHGPEAYGSSGGVGATADAVPGSSILARR